MSLNKFKEDNVPLIEAIRTFIPEDNLDSVLAIIQTWHETKNREAFQALGKDLRKSLKTISDKNPILNNTFKKLLSKIDEE